VSFRERQVGEIIPNKKEEYIERMRQKSLAFTKWWRRLRSTDYTLQFIIIVGAGSVPFLLTIPQVPKFIPTVISTIVFVAASLASYFNFRERSHVDRAAAEAIWKEIEFYKLNSGRYKTLEGDEAFNLFVETTQQLLDEHQTRSTGIDRPIKDQNQK
jgi:hypothetical protein